MDDEKVVRDPLSHLSNDDKEFLHRCLYLNPRLAIVVGSGVSIALSENATSQDCRAPTWEQLLERLGEAAWRGANRPSRDWLENYRAVIKRLGEVQSGLKELQQEKELEEAKSFGEAPKGLEERNELEEKMEKMLTSCFDGETRRVTPKPAGYRHFIYNIFRRLTYNPGANAELIPTAINDILKKSWSIRDPNVSGGWLLSLNYDTLLDDALNRSPISQMDLRDGYPNIEDMVGQKIYLGDQDTFESRHVIHLHGLYTDRGKAGGFALTRTEYKRSVKTFGDFMEQVLTNHEHPARLLFIGCQRALADEHFTALFKRLEDISIPGGVISYMGSSLPRRESGKYHFSDIEHVILVRDDRDPANPGASTYDEILETIAGIQLKFRVKIRPIIYGTRHDDLGLFLEAFASIKG